MAKLISCGHWSKYYYYILITNLARFIKEDVLGISVDGKVLVDLKVTSHPIIILLVGYLSDFFLSLLLWFFLDYRRKKNEDKRNSAMIENGEYLSKQSTPDKIFELKDGPSRNATFSDETENEDLKKSASIKTDYSLKIDRTEEKISNVIQVQSSNTPLFLSVESLEFSELKLQEEKTDPTNTVGKQQKQSCYIATAIYGSYDCPEVWTLRRYRDYTLAETWYGRAFICAYYAISPTIVKWFGKTVFFTCFWRFALDKMIKRLNTMGVVNTPYEDRNW